MDLPPVAGLDHLAHGVEDVELERRDLVKRTVERVPQRGGPLAHLAVAGVVDQLGPERGAIGLLDVSLGEEQAFLLGAADGAVPEGKVVGHGAERYQDDPGREVVDCGREELVRTAGVLVFRHAVLPGDAVGLVALAHLGHVHAVVIDQHEPVLPAPSRCRAGGRHARSGASAARS